MQSNLFSKRPVLSLIVAKTRNHVIGRDGDMPWSLPEDLKRFRRLTSGCPVIMGRSTWDSLPRKPLPKRPNIIVSRNPDFLADQAWVASNLEVAISMAESMAAQKQRENVFVIGGGTLYEAALPFAHQLHLTEILDEIEGDTFFPVIDEADWIEAEREERPRDEANSHPTLYRKLIRRPH